MTLSYWHEFAFTIINHQIKTQENPIIHHSQPLKTNEAPLKTNESPLKTNESPLKTKHTLSQPISPQRAGAPSRDQWLPTSPRRDAPVRGRPAPPPSTPGPYLGRSQTQRFGIIWDPRDVQRCATSHYKTLKNLSRSILYTYIYIYSCSWPIIV